jgi:hypothetical protein
MVMERVNASPEKPKFRPIGEILQAADLISAEQIARASGAICLCQTEKTHLDL